MAKIASITNIKGLQKDIVGKLEAIEVGVLKKKYPRQKWSTVEVANYAENEDKVFTDPWKKLNKKQLKTIENSIVDIQNKGKTTKKNLVALKNIVINPILDKKYGRNKKSTLEYKTGNTKWLNTGKFINNIFVKLKVKKK